jgi:hypothetical protein
MTVPVFIVRLSLGITTFVTIGSAPFCGKLVTREGKKLEGEDNTIKIVDLRNE